MHGACSDVPESKVPILVSWGGLDRQGMQPRVPPLPVELGVGSPGGLVQELRRRGRGAGRVMVAPAQG
eukprot:11214797-Lingulodinium_polyedra.AAC.1